MKGIHSAAEDIAAEAEQASIKSRAGRDLSKEEREAKLRELAEKATTLLPSEQILKDLKTGDLSFRGTSALIFQMSNAFQAMSTCVAWIQDCRRKFLMTAEAMDFAARFPDLAGNIVVSRKSPAGRRDRLINRKDDPNQKNR